MRVKPDRPFDTNISDISGISVVLYELLNFFLGKIKLLHKIVHLNSVWITTPWGKILRIQQK